MEENACVQSFGAAEYLFSELSDGLYRAVRISMAKLPLLTFFHACFGYRAAVPLRTGIGKPWNTSCRPWSNPREGDGHESTHYTRRDACVAREIATSKRVDREEYSQPGNGCARHHRHRRFRVAGYRVRSNPPRSFVLTPVQSGCHSFLFLCAPGTLFSELLDIYRSVRFSMEKLALLTFIQANY